MKTRIFLICLLSYIFTSCHPEYPIGYIDKWDGSTASCLSDSGTITDPHIIETAAEFVLLKDYGNNGQNSKTRYFKLVNDIDLGNIPWPEINLSNVVIDGKGHTIYNLRITRSGDNLGLFATANKSSIIKNLTINGVNINSPTSNKVGGIVGELDPFYGNQKINIINCSIILNESSIIRGNKYVGGIVGSGSSSHNGFNIERCKVEESAPNRRIIGNNYVGGIVGKPFLAKITDSHVSVNILGADYVGGIVGYIDATDISDCSFNGCVEGESYVGGIAGSYNSHNRYNIIACKSNASITVTDDCAGGIVGSGSAYACYANGTVNCELSSSKYIGGISGSGSCYHCYSTVTSSHKKFDGITGSYSSATECATITSSSNASASENAINSENITEAMMQFYSEYAEYFNYNNTWNWIGEVNGVTKNVSCPKLYWE